MRPSALLRRVLVADAAISGLAGLLMALDAGPLEDTLGVPASLLRAAGFSLVPFALGVGALARREGLASAHVWTVIGLNVLWAVGSVWLLVIGTIQPNGLGQALVLGQAFAVGLLAELQYVGLRRSPALAA